LVLAVHDAVTVDAVRNECSGDRVVAGVAGLLAAVDARDNAHLNHELGRDGGADCTDRDRLEQRRQRADQPDHALGHR
jgi:hypothetical protein